MKAKLMLGAAALAVGFFVNSALAEVFTWEDGAVVPVGCQGAGDNNLNNNANTMYFVGDGWIHGTYTPKSAKPSGWAIWRNYLITNGTVVIEGVSDDTVDPPTHYNFPPCFRRSVVLGDLGRLVVSNNNVMLGSDRSKDTQSDLYDVKGLSFVDANGQPCAGKVTLNNGATIVGFPTDGSATLVIDKPKDKGRLAVAGPDVLKVYGTTFDLYKIWIFDDAYIPAGSTVKISATTTCVLTKRGIDPTMGDLLNTAVSHELPWTDYGAYGESTHPIELSGTLELESTAGCAFSGKVTGAAAASTVKLPGGTTNTFAEVAGTIRFLNTSAPATVVRIAKAAVGTRLFAAKGVELEIAADPAEWTTCEGNGGTWHIFANRAGTFDFGGIDKPLRLTAAAPLGSATYIDPRQFGDVNVSVGAGVEVNASVTASAQPSFVLASGTLRLAASVLGQATLWIDPSDDSTFYKLGTAIPDSVMAKIQGKPTALTTTADGSDLVEAFADKRPSQTTYCLRHHRHYDGLIKGEKTNLEDLPYVFPRRVKGGPNGLAYLSMANSTSRRIQTSTGPLDTSSETLPADKQLNGQKLVVMVFGSQGGGGNAILGVSDTSLTRSGTTAADPIAGGSFAGDIWIDGVKTNRTATLSGGWQVISLDVTGHNIDCFGWAEKNYLKSGGQNYGEVLVFPDALTDAERVSVETYLAKKWGVAAYRPPATDLPPPAKATLHGSDGTVSVEGNVRVSGLYSGDFAVAEGATLDVTGAYAPEIPSEGRLLWFDPDCEGAITYKAVHTPNAIHGLWQRGKTEQTTAVGELFLHGVNSRAPYAVPYARGFGKTRTWIDYEHPVAPAKQTSSDGNTLRIREWTGDIDDSSYQQSASDRPQDVRTVFIVTDSIRGGGDPLQKSVSNGGNWGSRGTATADKAIWTGAGSVITQGATHLNGRAIDGAATGYTGEAEVLSVRATNSVALCNFGRYVNTEKVEGFGERIGEILLYTAALSDEQMKTIDDYLLFKWTGIAPAGYGDFTGATVTSGAGTVTAAKFADLPKFDDGFTGTIAVTDETCPTFEMAVPTEGAAVDGAVIAKGATLKGFAAATINVRVPAKTFGEFVLVDAAAVDAPIAWTVNLVGDLTDGVKAASSVIVSGNGKSVVLKVVHPGSMVIVR